MTEFKVGDRVRVVRQNPQYREAQKANIGDVGCIVEYRNPQYLVKFDRFDKPCDYYIHQTSLELIEHEQALPDKVLVDKTEYENLIKLKDIALKWGYTDVNDIAEYDANQEALVNFLASLEVK